MRFDDRSESIPLIVEDNTLAIQQSYDAVQHMSLNTYNSHSMLPSHFSEELNQFGIPSDFIALVFNLVALKSNCTTPKYNEAFQHIYNSCSLLFDFLTTHQPPNYDEGPEDTLSNIDKSILVIHQLKSNKSDQFIEEAIKIRLSIAKLKSKYCDAIAARLHPESVPACAIAAKLSPESVMQLIESLPVTPIPPKLYQLSFWTHLVMHAWIHAKFFSRSTLAFEFFALCCGLQAVYDDQFVYASKQHSDSNLEKQYSLVFAFGGSGLMTGIIAILKSNADQLCSLWSSNDRYYSLSYDQPTDDLNETEKFQMTNEFSGIYADYSMHTSFIDLLFHILSLKTHCRGNKYLEHFTALMNDMEILFHIIKTEDMSDGKDQQSAIDLRFGQINQRINQEISNIQKLKTIKSHAFIERIMSLQMTRAEMQKYFFDALNGGGTPHIRTHTSEDYTKNSLVYTRIQQINDPIPKPAIYTPKRWLSAIAHAYTHAKKTMRGSAAFFICSACCILQTLIDDRITYGNVDGDHTDEIERYALSIGLLGVSILIGTFAIVKTHFSTLSACCRRENPSFLSANRYFKHKGMDYDLNNPSSALAYLTVIRSDRGTINQNATRSANAIRTLQAHLANEDTAMTQVFKARVTEFFNDNAISTHYYQNQNVFII